MKNEMFLSKVFLSIAGGIVLTALFFMSHAPLHDLFHPHESMSLVHLCFGLFFFVVLFWLGFSVTWVIYSLIAWFADTVRYNIRYRGKGEKDEQKTLQLTGPKAETAPIPETQGQSELENEQVEDQTSGTSVEDKTATQGLSLSEGQSEGPMLTREEFSRLIENSGLPINKVAEELGISRQMVSYIIHGKRCMTGRISDKAREVFRHHR